MDIRVELLGILEEEELYWHKRSESWLMKGDNNTKYFHRIANGKKRKQIIYSLNHGDSVIQGQEGLIYFLKHGDSVIQGQEGLIYFLKHGDSVIQGQEGLMKLATEYYKELFGLGAGNMFVIDPNLWQMDENVTAMENDHLTRPFGAG
jgi:hypothetical protein